MLSESRIANWSALSDHVRIEGLEISRATRLSLTVRHVLNSRTPAEAEQARNEQERRLWSEQERAVAWTREAKQAGRSSPTAQAA